MSGWVELLWHRKRERDFTKENVEENYVHFGKNPKTACGKYPAELFWKSAYLRFSIPKRYYQRRRIFF